MNDTLLRASLAALLLGLLLLAERRWPFRPAARVRWWPNIALGALGAGLLALLPVLAPLAAAQTALQQGWGLLPHLLLPGAVQAVLAFVLLDAAIYAQHRALHAQPLLWRLHRTHHLDPALDATSGLRFHPLEALLSATYKSAIVLLLGAPPVAVAAFVLALNLGSLFSHANLHLPSWLDHPLRALLVTPAMHRIHHSVHGDEQRSNYGFFLPWWDRLLGSYRAHPHDGEAGLRMGVLEASPCTPQTLKALLMNPLRG